MAATVMLGLDVGSVRIGVARVRSDVNIPQPLTTLAHGEDMYRAIAALVDQESANALVVGWPRNLQSQATQQTHFVENFVAELKQHVTVPIYMQDEALTSQKAEAELQARNKPYQKADVDALAATFILEDYLSGHGVAHV
jgi:putative Holliday junction resolvase